MTTEKDSDVLIATCSTKEELEMLRSTLGRSMRLWLFAYKRENSYELTASNEFGGRLSSSVIETLKVTVEELLPKKLDEITSIDREIADNDVDVFETFSSTS